MKDSVRVIERLRILLKGDVVLGGADGEECAGKHGDEVS